MRLTASAVDAGDAGDEGDEGDEGEGEAVAEGESAAEEGEVTLQMGQLPLRKLHDYTLHDAAGQLCRCEVLSERPATHKGPWKSAHVYASGFVCHNTDGADEQEAEDACAGESAGYYVSRLGPFTAYVVSGYSQHDAHLFPRPSLFLQSELAEYELAEPAAPYAPYLAPMLEKVELCKRVVRALEASPAQTLPQLLAAVAAEAQSRSAAISEEQSEPQSELTFDEGFVTGHGRFVLEQLRSYDIGAKAGELRTCGCPAVQALFQQLGLAAPGRGSGGGGGGGGGGGSGGRRAAGTKDVRVRATKVEWVSRDAAVSAAAVTAAVIVDGQTIRLGGTASLQPFVSHPAAAEDERELVRVEAFSLGDDATSNQGGTKAKPKGTCTDVGAIMCTVRRLWRPAETFIFSGDAAASFDDQVSNGLGVGHFPPPGALLPDTSMMEIPISHLCRPVHMRETQSPDAIIAAIEAGEAVSYHVGPWSYSPRFATYSLDAAAPAPAAAPAAAAAGAPQLAATAAKRRRGTAVAACGAGAEPEAAAEAGRTTLNVLELYAGGGGLSFTQTAGPIEGRRLRVRWCCEWSREEAQTLRANHADCTVFHMGVEPFLHACRRWATMARGGTPGRREAGLPVGKKAKPNPNPNPNPNPSPNPNQVRRPKPTRTARPRRRLLRQR